MAQVRGSVGREEAGDSRRLCPDPLSRDMGLAVLNWAQAGTKLVTSRWAEQREDRTGYVGPPLKLY